jgi:glycosyltransferase involved in cell wall biosynthesis
MNETTTRPSVSVCVPTFNAAEYLTLAIESVLQQEFTDFELLICDDASTDTTPEICRRYDVDPRVRYVRFEENAGQAGNFNRCFREARGEFVTLLSADDYFLPDLLLDRVTTLRSHPEIGFVVGATQVVDARGSEVSINGTWPENRFFEPGEFVKPLLFGAVVNTLSLVFRKGCLNQIGLFRTDLTWGHDWEWIIRLAERYGGCYVSEPSAAYRVHDASGTVEQLNAAKNGPQERRILKDTLARLSASDARFNEMQGPVFHALSLRHMYFAEQALVGGRRVVARNNLYYAALADSMMLTRPTFWALLFGSFAPATLYARYRALRDARVAPGSQL